MSLKKLPSINAVAEHAGVSIATVSRVLNNSKPVGEATRQRVEAAVLELGFRANAFGRNLARARSNLLLVLVPDVANPFYGQIVQGVETVARQRGYKIVLADTSGDDEPHRTGLDAVYDRLADGVISLAHLDESEPVLQELRRVPWVACSEFVPDASMPYVSIDHRQAAIDAVQYLLNRGHRRIALIAADERFRWARQRHEGYALALERAGIAVDPALVRIAPGTDFAMGAQRPGPCCPSVTAHRGVRGLGHPRHRRHQGLQPRGPARAARHRGDGLRQHPVVRGVRTGPHRPSASRCANWAPRPPRCCWSGWAAASRWPARCRTRCWCASRPDACSSAQSG